MSVTAKRPITLRINVDDLAEIDRLADEHKLNRTDYLVNAALGKLDKLGIERRLDDIDERIHRLEATTALAYT